MGTRILKIRKTLGKIGGGGIASRIPPGHFVRPITILQFTRIGGANAEITGLLIFAKLFSTLQFTCFPQCPVRFLKSQFARVRGATLEIAVYSF